MTIFNIESRIYTNFLVNYLESARFSATSFVEITVSFIILIFEFTKNIGSLVSLHKSLYVSFSFLARVFHSSFLSISLINRNT